MFKSMFNKKTSKADVIFAVAAALVAIYKAGDTIKDYRSDVIEMENQK